MLTDVCDCSANRLLAQREDEINDRLRIVGEREQECRDRAQQVEQR